MPCPHCQVRPPVEFSWREHGIDDPVPVVLESRIGSYGVLTYNGPATIPFETVPRIRMPSRPVRARIASERAYSERDSASRRE